MAYAWRKIYCAFAGIYGGNMNFIPSEKYAQILEVLPILCVDIVIKNFNREYLLVKRVNEPLKGKWWVIGGRVIKGETLEDAAIRKIEEEVGLRVSTVKPIGYYEDIAHTNRFGSSTPLHSVSIVFITEVDNFKQVKLDSQSSEWKSSHEIPKKFCVKAFKTGR